MTSFSTRGAQGRLDHAVDVIVSTLHVAQEFAAAKKEQTSNFPRTDKFLNQKNVSEVRKEP